MRHNKVTKRVFSLWVFLTLGSLGMAQEMNEGFDMLQEGRFAAAKLFFEEILTTYPENTTALICYGRAVGLTGDAEKALGIFEQLLAQDSANLEVQLNRAEAFLWAREPGKAIVAYQHILASDSTLFAAGLGLANGYSMAKQYDSAYRAIHRALEANPIDPQAMLSRKYIVLGYANQLGTVDYQLDKALHLIETNLDRDPSDQETLQLKALLLLLDKQYAASIGTYALLADSTAAYAGQSVVYHLAGKDRIALQMAEKALRADSIAGGSSLATAKQYLTALLWNGRYTQAGAYLAALKKAHQGVLSMLLAEASYATYLGAYTVSQDRYLSYLASDTSSFEGNLGLADAYHAQSMDRAAYLQALTARRYYQHQKDLQQFLTKLHRQHSPQLRGRLLLNGSSDGSYNRSYLMEGQLNLSPEVSVNAGYEEKKYFRSGGTSSLSSQKASAGVGYQLGKRTSVKGGVSFMQLANPTDSVDYGAAVLPQVTLSHQVHRYDQLQIGYQSGFQNFNIDLIAQQLKTHDLFVRNNYYHKGLGFGSYTELFRSYNSDGNRRNLLFTSLYQNFGRKRSFKAGLNYLRLSFARQLPEAYFSPERHQQVELFSAFNYATRSEKKTEILLESALGRQWSDGRAEFTLRGQLAVTQHFGRWKAKAFGAYSTAANPSGRGFTYQELGFELSFQLTARPLFFKKLEGQIKK